MNAFLSNVHAKAILRGASVVFPESDDIRVLQACNHLALNALCKVHLVANSQTFESVCMDHDLKMHHSVSVHFVDRPDSEHLSAMAQHLHDRRKSKGMSIDQAYQLCAQPLWYAAGLVATRVVDACVAGAVNTTGDVLRAGLQMIGLAEGSSVVSGSFMMSWSDGNVFAYADCAVFPYPDPEQLAAIAADTASMYFKLTDIAPKVAFLSFSTGTSANHERVDLVRKALEVFKNAHAEIAADGPLQFDAALLEEIGKKKAPGSAVAGQANVFIFPNLDAGNIAYKITERLGGAVATGPIIQGLLRPMNDLSRGASTNDIVDTACIAALMS
jgi:phosphate acetyltransferase